jgi:hypothetical protein
MGKLILLQRVREDAARAALASAQAAEDRARDAERDADGRRRAAGEAAAAARQTPPPGEAPPAQVLHLADVRRRQLHEVFVALEVHLAKLRGERITAEQARERKRASWEVDRERRRKLEERLRAARREARRRRERAAESAQDDLPPRGEGDG